MRSVSVLCALAGLASAFPAGFEASINQRQGGGVESQCGSIPCPTFHLTEQFVDVRDGTIHEYVAPTNQDKRGPCPGLNAAANHGFISHNGISTIQEGMYIFPIYIFTLLKIRRAIFEGYGFSPDLAGFLATYATIFSGDVSSFS